MGPWHEGWQAAFRKMGMVKDDCYYEEHCYFCNEKPYYNQPDKETGEYRSVCNKHFYMNGAS